MSESVSESALEEVDVDPASAPDIPRMHAALERVTSWHRTARTDLDSQRAELQTEADQTDTKITELDAALLELRERQAELEGRLEELDELSSGLQSEQSERLRMAVVEVLRADLALVGRRGDLYRDARSQRERQLEELAQDPEIARLVQEYEQFVEVEPTLSLLPSGYRKAILSHHEAVRRRLQPLFDAIARELDPIDAEPAAVSVLASLAQEEGSPVALVFIMPVKFEVYRDWSTAGEDLSALIAYRVIGAISGALDEVDCGDAAIRYTEIDGQLAMQVWLGDSDGPSSGLRTAVRHRFNALREQSSELKSMLMTLHLAWVEPEVIESIDATSGEGDSAGA